MKPGQAQCVNVPRNIFAVRRERGGVEEALKEKSRDLSSGSSSVTIHQWRLWTVSSL